ncbi:MAG: class I tRNA ligase family protein, partial [Hyphomicrobiaceae bacterium]
MAKNKAGGSQKTGRDWRETLFLPQTDFPMRAGLPKREPEALARWDRLGLYERLRKLSKGREKFVLHDGPPYANGHLHIGHALNKILKDVITRSQQMMGKDSNYVPGWDCHGLPIEWKIEEQYRAKGKNKDEVPTVDFRRECREFAEHWIDVQRTEFKRMGVEGDWANPYTTMSFDAEATIAEELMKFAMNGALYRGSKPVMWSVVERTALAEAEIEYHDYQSDTVWVKFPFDNWDGTRDDSEKGEIRELLSDASIVIWTTTPWTIPGNRAICYSDRVSYGMYQVTEAPKDNWARVGDKLILADRLADGVMKQARVEGFKKILDVTPDMLRDLCCEHPLKKLGYDFKVPLLEADHVTDEEGTGFVHTAPGHGREDFDIWMDRGPWLKENQ